MKYTGLISTPKLKVGDRVEGNIDNPPIQGTIVRVQNRTAAQQCRVRWDNGNESTHTQMAIRKSQP